MPTKDEAIAQQTELTTKSIQAYAQAIRAMVEVGRAISAKDLKVAWPTIETAMEGMGREVSLLRYLREGDREASQKG